MHPEPEMEKNAKLHVAISFGITPFGRETRCLGKSYRVCPGGGSKCRVVSL